MQGRHMQFKNGNGALTTSSNETLDTRMKRYNSELSEITEL